MRAGRVRCGRSMGGRLGGNRGVDSCSSGRDGECRSHSAGTANGDGRGHCLGDHAGVVSMTGARVGRSGVARGGSRGGGRGLVARTRVGAGAEETDEDEGELGADLHLELRDCAGGWAMWWVGGSVVGERLRGEVGGAGRRGRDYMGIGESDGGDPKPVFARCGGLWSGPRLVRVRHRRGDRRSGPSRAPSALNSAAGASVPVGCPPVISAVNGLWSLVDPCAPPSKQLSEKTYLQTDNEIADPFPTKCGSYQAHPLAYCSANTSQKVADARYTKPLTQGHYPYQLQTGLSRGKKDELVERNKRGDAIERLHHGVSIPITTEAPAPHRGLDPNNDDLRNTQLKIVCFPVYQTFLRLTKGKGLTRIQSMLYKDRQDVPSSCQSSTGDRRKNLENIASSTDGSMRLNIAGVFAF